MAEATILIKSIDIIAERISTWLDLSVSHVSLFKYACERSITKTRRPAKKNRHSEFVEMRNSKKPFIILGCR